MIHRKFDNLKFRRTYIGGSKKSENQIFKDVQGNRDDNSECDWLEYRRLLTLYIDDKLNIILSWRYVTHVLSIALAAIALFALTQSVNLALILVAISMLLYLVTKYLTYKEKHMLSGYNFTLDTVLKIIYEQTGLNLSK